MDTLPTVNERFAIIFVNDGVVEFTIYNTDTDVIARSKIEYKYATAFIQPLYDCGLFHSVLVCDDTDLHRRLALLGVCGCVNETIRDYDDW